LDKYFEWSNECRVTPASNYLYAVSSHEFEQDYSVDFNTMPRQPTDAHRAKSHMPDPRDRASWRLPWPRRKPSRAPWPINPLEPSLPCYPQH
jgi:hypothetical protein